MNSDFALFLAEVVLELWMNSPLDDIREKIRSHLLPDESAVLEALVLQADLSVMSRRAISQEASGLIRKIRNNSDPGLMESFLAEYGLSTDEGIALMCLAEALLRVPDAETIDALIEDKIVPSDWGKHLGKSSSSLVKNIQETLQKIAQHSKPSISCWRCGSQF